MHIKDSRLKPIDPTHRDDTVQAPERQNGGDRLLFFSRGGQATGRNVLPRPNVVPFQLASPDRPKGQAVKEN